MDDKSPMTETPVTLKDLRVSERRIERAMELSSKRLRWARVAETALEQERERHDALVEKYRTQGRA